MATSPHFERMRQLFEQRVLPKFPTSKQRFRRHFMESYETIRSFKPNGSGGDEWNPQSKNYMRVHLPLQLAFTLLGIKPLSLVENWHPSMKPGLQEMLVQAGLETRVHRKPYTDPGTEVYDPVLASPEISKMLGRRIRPRDVAGFIEEATYDMPFSHELLGYPQPHPGIIISRVVEVPWNGQPGSIEPTTQGISTLVYLDIQNGGSTGKSNYISHMGCMLGDPKAALSLLRAYASAAALVEDIRKSPLGITSSAAIIERTYFVSLTQDLNLTRQISGRTIGKVSIARTGEPGRWMEICRQ